MTLGSSTPSGFQFAISTQTPAAQQSGHGVGIHPLDSGSGGGGNGGGSGSGSGSGSGYGTPVATLNQSGDSLGYTDPNNVHYNQVGGAEGIAISTGWVGGSGPPDPTTVQWSVSGGAYSGINTSLPDRSGFNPTNLTSWQGSGPYSGEFWWNEKPGTKTVTAVATYSVGGSTVQATGSISIIVQAPTLVSMTRQYQGVVKGVSDNTVIARNIGVNAQGQQTAPGEVFSAQIATNGLNPNLPGSNYFFLQTVNPQQVYVSSNGVVGTLTGPSSTVPMLDSPTGSFVYLGWSTAAPIPAGLAGPIAIPDDGTVIEDNPTGGTGAGDQTTNPPTPSDADDYANKQTYTETVQFTNSFVMYLMFQPPDGIPSAIGQVQWQFAFTLTFNGGQQGQPTSAYYLDPNNWTLSGTTPAGPDTASGSAVNMMPKWKGWYPDDLQ